MAKTERKKAPRFTSPRGVLRFPSIVKPDFGTKEFPKPDGRWKTGLILVEDSPATVEFFAKLQPLYDEALKEAQKEFAALKKETREKLGEVKPQNFFTRQFDPETEEPTGKVVLNFAKKYSGENKKEQRTWKADPPFLFDAKGTPVKSKDLQVWGGTEAKVNFSASPYFIPGSGAAGLTLRLMGVQIIKLVNKGAATAADMGFEAEEDGFEFDPDAESNPFGADEGTTGSTASADAPDDF